MQQVTIYQNLQKKSTQLILKSNVDKLHVDKLVSVSVDLSKLSDVVRNDVVKEDVYNAKVKNIEDKIPDITNLASNTTLNAIMNEFKGKIHSITNLATNASLDAKINEGKKYLILLTWLLFLLLLLLKNKIPNVSNLVKKNN